MAQPAKVITPTFGALMDLIATLRGENGCPWDRKQTPSTLSVYLIEEVFELVEAIAADDTAAIQEEMGDVLFQVLFLLHLYHEQRRFAPTDALERIIRKMVHRHPHVFGTDKVENAEEVKQRWREIKQKEKGHADTSLMDTVPSGLPALMRSYRVSERAAGIGFDWDSLAGVLTQTEAEWDEFKAELGPQAGAPIANKEKATEEFGDILFTMVNVARLAGIHPETALSKSTQKFVRRFKEMERMAASQSKALKDLPRDEMEALWEQAKKNQEPH
ncbi:MAG: nucleoside triphosphate pyrophosphohydrolase [Desulfobacteraceae bacterium]|nr:nucleoside triphosphate pyrophosphohydrolase [Desulfobacteraceae bacterium]